MALILGNGWVLPHTGKLIHYTGMTLAHIAGDKAALIEQWRED